MFEKFKHDSKNNFYPVEADEVKELENALNIKLPKELKQFYQEVGYGFFYSRKGHNNRLMDTFSVRDFRLKKDDLDFYVPDIEIYEPYEKFSLYFFEVHESMFFSIELNNKDKQKIFMYDVPIATSLLEFCELISNDENFYLKFLN